MRDLSSRVVCDFTVPEQAPKAVRAADEAYRRLCEQLAEARAAETAATGAIAEGHRADVQKLADAFRAGKSAPQLSHENENEARAAAESARVRLEALERAVDEAGDAVLDALEGEQNSWLREVEREIAEAESAYSAAIEAARSAVEMLAASRSMAEWLGRLDVRRARTGGGGMHLTQRWNGAFGYQLLVPAPGTHGSIGMETVPAVELLAALERAVAPAGEPVDELAAGGVAS
jgi:hypothetical protein